MLYQEIRLADERKEEKLDSLLSKEMVDAQENEVQCPQYPQTVPIPLHRNQKHPCQVLSHTNSHQKNYIYTQYYKSKEIVTFITNYKEN